MKGLIGLIILVPLISGCTGISLNERLDVINSQPYISDSIQVHKYKPISIEPLTTVDGTPSSLLRRHEQHKLDRATIKYLNQALAAKSSSVESLRLAMKNIEVADRATQRANAHLQAALKDEQDTATLNDVKHTILEIILMTVFLLK